MPPRSSCARSDRMRSPAPPPRELIHGIEALAHDVGEPVVDGVLRPEVPAAVLHPLEVRHRDAAGVREDVRNDEHALLVKNGIRARGGWTIRAFADDLRADL